MRPATRSYATAAVVSLLLIGGVLLLNTAVGQTAVDKAAPRSATPGVAGVGDAMADDPVALLRRSAEFTSRLPRATLELAYHLRVTKGEEQKKADSSFRVLLGREGRFAVGPTGGTLGPQIHSNGAQMIVLPPGAGADPMEFSITHGVAALASSRPASWIGHGLGGLTLSLLSPVSSDALLESVREPAALGREKIRVGDAEHDCYHGRVTTGQLTWDFWVDAGDKPLMRRIVPDLSEEPEPGTPPEEVENAQITVDFNQWDLASEPPAGAFLVSKPPHPMLGKRAPPVKLPLLGGGTQELSELIGKKVIVLDFWATWCPPCIGSLPTLDKVVSEYADRGVVAFAINAGDEVAELKAFMAERDWKLPIALDEAGEINRVLKPGNGLPTSLIIGLDGRVQVAGAGVPASTEAYRKKLEEEFDALLAKKDLASEAVESWGRMSAVFADGE